MTKSPSTTLEQLDARLREQSLEMAALRAAIDTQFTRIAQMQAELDSLPHARLRRAMLMARLSPVPARNGNGRSHR